MTLGNVADEVGLATSNVVRYSGTREEIYLELTAQGWEQWVEAVADLLLSNNGSGAWSLP